MPPLAAGFLIGGFTRAAAGAAAAGAGAAGTLGGLALAVRLGAAACR